MGLYSPLAKTGISSDGGLVTIYEIIWGAPGPSSVMGGSSSVKREDEDE